MNLKTAEIVIVGPGAIGSLVAATLARAGESVCLLDHRPARAAALANDGITVQENDGHCWTTHPACSAHPAVVTGADYVIICVKAGGTETVCRQLAAVLKAHTTLVSLQNGLGNLEQLEAIFPHRVLAGTTGTGAVLEAPGQVRHTGTGLTWLAERTLSGQAAAEALASRLTAAGLETRRHPDPQAMLWSKLVVNAAINPVSAIFRLTNGALPDHAEAGPLARTALIEAVQVAKAAGVALDETDMLAAFEKACRQTAANRSSMLRDVEHGRQTEIEAITGAVIRQAASLEVPVPVNERLRQQVAGLA